jgi:hypothetical protein
VWRLMKGERGCGVRVASPLAGLGDRREKRELALSGIAGIKIRRGCRMLGVFVVMLAATCAWAWAQSARTVPLAPAAVLRIDISQPGNEFAPGAVGLSVDTRELGTGNLTAERYRLVRLMRLLGPSVLRIGGDGVDLSWWTSSDEPPPSWATSAVTPGDLSVLHGLLTATGWRVLLGVDFGHFEPARAADEAHWAQEILGTSLLGIEIGNEPNDYISRRVALRPLSYGVSDYLREAEAYRQALTVAAPSVAVYGPATGGVTPWLTEMGAATNMFTTITQHYYPIVSCPDVLPLAAVTPPTAVELLSPMVRRQEEVVLEVLHQAGAVADRPTRIGETGSAGCTGHAYASPLFASALWSLDWSLRAASSGVSGLNFQGGLGDCSSNSQDPICAPGSESTRAQPEYYGLLAARQLESGRFVPTRLIAPGPLPNLTTWATFTARGIVRVAIDNFAIAGLAQPVSISIPGYVAATAEALIGPSVEARSGIALGRATMNGEGEWRPRTEALPRVHGFFRVDVRPASAMVITLLPKRRSS